ncbi:MAG: hypothetical protein RLZ76_765 [Bacteroidota bacterium]|jgi:hypothetical protein
MEGLVNKVAESGIITLDLEKFYPRQEVVGLDVKDFLFMEMLLKEKDFREKLETTDWSQFNGKIVAVHCSTDAIIPMWAFMLVSSKLKGFASEVYFGNKQIAIEKAMEKNMLSIDEEEYKDKRVVVKGCGDIAIPSSAFLMISQKLIPVVKSLMYGEPCSTVPVYKQKK